MNDFAKVLELPVSQLHTYLSKELQMNLVHNLFAGDSVSDQPSDQFDTDIDEELKVRRLTSAQIKAMEILQLPLEDLQRRIAEEQAEMGALVEPDIIVERLQTGEYQVRVPQSLLMQLSVNPRFAGLHQSSATDAQEKNRIGQLIRRAQQLIDALQQRQSILQLIGAEIIRQQQPFLENGERYLQPCTEEFLAQAISIDKQLVGLAMKDKQIQTPQGVLPLKRFVVCAPLQPDD